ncbi:MAG: penicillin-binding transpeptidase domain-containing protein, partial [Phycisphaerales bacterium]
LDVLEQVRPAADSSDSLGRIAEAIASAKARGDAFAESTLRAVEKNVKQPIAEQKGQHTLAARIDDALAFSLDLLSQETARPDISLVPERWRGVLDLSRVPEVAVVPGVKVADTGDRAYPYERMEVEVDAKTLPGPLRSDEPVLVTVDGVACHILGRMLDRVFAEDAGARRDFLDRNPSMAVMAMGGSFTDRGSYRDLDRVGDTGIEGSQEHFLRGLRGVQTRHLDTGGVDAIDAQGGRDVALSIDIMLQARVQALMSRELGLAVVQPWHHQESQTQPMGTVLNGAAVVLDVDTGDILAMVSTPTFTREQARTDPESIFGDKLRMPYLNRAIGMPYPPGSIVKALVLAESMSRGTYTEDQRIACNGHLLEGKPNIYRCWIYKRFQTTHSVQLGHDLSADEGLMCSCNIFFFTLGRRLDVPGVVDLYKRFGVGKAFGLGVGIESEGHIGFIEPGTNSSPNDGSDLATPDAIQMGIGQGPIAWTPLHAANAYATLARRGVAYSPRLILGAPRPDPVDLELPQGRSTLRFWGCTRA